MKTGVVTVALNLGAFIVLTSLPAFQNAHHHWIFPALTTIFTLEWFVVRSSRARDVLLFILAFLLLMGLIRHETILTCPERCGFKLSIALLLGTLVFFLHGRTATPFWWDRARSHLAALASGMWAIYLVLHGIKMAPWALEIVFVIVALLLWLGRTNPAARAAAIGIVLELGIRRVGTEYGIIFLSLIVVAAAFASLRRFSAGDFSPPPRPPSLLIKVVRTLALLAIVLIVGLHAVGPIYFMLDPGKRWQWLTTLAPVYPPLESRAHSPLANRLKNHVLYLSETIGERAAYQQKAQLQARDYISRELKSYGYAPTLLSYESVRLYSIKDGVAFYNVEAVTEAGKNSDRGILLVSAHYDTAPGTPGADDNASGVAVLLEVARLVKDRALDREVRFVAFGSEEPPAFGTQNMGSYHYARALRDKDVKVAGLINLEMVGYFNPRQGAQLYPPFLHMFFPDHGNFIAVVSNFYSRGFLSSFRKNWSEIRDLPLVAATLPSAFSGVTLSDQLNFWNEGFPAVMVSDTSFFRNPHYHENSDTAEKLNYRRMAEITAALVDAVAGMAGEGERK